MDDPVPTEAPTADIEMPTTRAYQQEMLNESMRSNIIIALDTGSGKTLIAVLRMKHEMEMEPTKISWFFAPTVALCAQQKGYIEKYIPVSVGLVSGANEPDQWKNAALWEKVVSTHRIMVSTPQVFLDALRHGYISLGRDISLLIFDEAHHAVDKHPYNRIMTEFYFELPPRNASNTSEVVRPMVLGLTASPIYGGNVEKAFKTIESNLDSTIRAPQRHRSELAQHVHRPIFKHIMYIPPDELHPFFSTNVAALSAVVNTLDIEKDPYVISLRSQLKRHARGTHDYNRVDQKLSKVIEKENSFTHKGLRDFERAAVDICYDLGPWAADWFVWKVVERAKDAADPFKNIMVSWRNTEKAYLLGILREIVISPVSYYPEDIEDDVSDKARALIDCLLVEKAETESLDDTYSSIVFVQRRDAVLALAALLKHHPATKDVFTIGTLLGTSDSAHRHSMMDITRSLVRESQDDTLSEFKSGEKNLIISTAVAEEGIDIQACGSVVRWDPPTNMASWAQSRGRARKTRSTFTVMFESGTKQQSDVQKWEELERKMVELYNDPSRDLAGLYDGTGGDDDEEDDDMMFSVASTGAVLTLHSAVSHLNHFCAVIPNSSHIDNRPLYDLDPPEFPEGWHAFAPRDRLKDAYPGPYGSKVTLPRTLPLPERQFSVDTIYKSISSAHRHVAFKAYMALYDAGLLNDYLLPITSIIEPELEEEVKAMLADVEKRDGTAKVTMGVDPWAPEDEAAELDVWYASELRVEGLRPLLLFTRTEHVAAHSEEGPVLYRPGIPLIHTFIHHLGVVRAMDSKIEQAREYTRTLFWGPNHTRMEWDDLDFAYLFLPVDGVDAEWHSRRSWLANLAADAPEAYPHRMMVKADKFGEAFVYPSDVILIQKNIGFGRPFKFIRWKHELLTSEEEARLREDYDKHFDKPLEIKYPILVVEAYPPRSNFLIPVVSKTKDTSVDSTHEPPPVVHLLPQHSGIILLSRDEAEYAFLLPSVLRFFSMSMTAHSLRKKFFASTPLKDISIPLLTVALTAPSSGERLNYQRLETLGDTVLKFVAGVQLLAEYPLWHEGYLTRKKDHAVSNVRLAKEDISRGLYRWIIRDIMLGKKWKPQYFTVKAAPSPDPPTPGSHADEVMSPAPAESQEESVAGNDDKMDAGGGEKGKKREEKYKKKKKKNDQLSTKVLADVVESTIGAAYLYGGYDMGYECLKFFGLGLKWEPLADRISQVLARVDASLPGPTEPPIHFPRQLVDVERMLGYTFERKLLLIEALTHASYQNDTRTPSYERMEFLGDSVLDMIVTDFLYRAPGKNYSPGHMHLRKSAVVNGHILAYICLKTSTTVSAVMPHPAADGAGGIEEVSEEQEIHLWQCLLHSNQTVLDDQRNTFLRFRKCSTEISDALMTSSMFPWAALTRLHAPKFLSDMVESIIGAIFLDSHGSIPVVQGVLDRLGIMPLLAHIVNDNVDVLHPVSRLSMWASKHEKEIEYDVKKVKGAVYCAIVVDGKEEIRVEEPWRGKASQEEVKYVAAEMAIELFKLRNAGANYELLKKKKVSRPKKKGKGKAQG